MDLAHVALWVSDLDRSLEFYRELGFEREWSFDADGVENVYVAADGVENVYVAADGVENVYVAADVGELQLRHDPDRTTPIAPSRADTDHVAFVVDDVDAVVDRARDAGGSIVADPHVVEAAGAYAGFVEDPDGHTLEFLSPLEDER